MNDTLTKDTPPKPEPPDAVSSADIEAKDALMAAERATAELDGTRAVVGHLVHEAVVRHTTKVEAVASLRERSAAAAVICIGDDQSDERVFASFTDLGVVAVGIKVGPGESVAQHRLEDPAAVVEVLQQLAVRLQR